MKNDLKFAKDGGRLNRSGKLPVHHKDAMTILRIEVRSNSTQKLDHG